MKNLCNILIVFSLSCVGVLQAQQGSAVLFRIGNDTITIRQALETIAANNKKDTLSISEFNDVLNFYLVIYDFKSRGEDSTKTFRRKLEKQKLNILGSIYSTENYDKLMTKLAVGRSSLVVVKDLFVPFDPYLLRSIQNIREKNGGNFDDVVEYAKGYEGSYLGTRIIYPSETDWSLQNAINELVEKQGSLCCVGPIKDSKGYHFLQFVREQENFGRYKTQVIYISDIEGAGKEKIDKAYKLLKSGVSFSKVAKEYSESFLSEEDGIKYFSPSINNNEIIEKELKKLTYDGALSKPFLVARGWYIIKRLGKEEYPLEKDQKEYALKAYRKPSFFIEELKERYNAQEFPHNFMTGKDEILFLIDQKAFYTKDLKKYAAEYGYNYTTDTYDKFFHHLLSDRYEKDIDTNRYKRLIDDFYYLQIINPLLAYNKGENTHDDSLKKLRQLIKKYNPIIPNTKYVENNPVFTN